MNLNATILADRKYWGSKQCIRTIWMHHEAPSDSGMMNNSMQFRPIEVQLALNWHAGYNLMSAIAGSPYFHSYCYSQKLPFLYSNFHQNLLFKHTWDWTLADSRYRLFMSFHELQDLNVWGWQGHASHRSSHWAQTSIQIVISSTSAKCNLVAGSLQECLRGCGV
jgi:hypothetical protein